MRQIPRIDEMALRLLSQQEELPTAVKISRFDDPKLNPMPRAPEKKSLPPGMVEMYTPESDFMEIVQVREGSPQHIAMLRKAEAMEPGSEEGKALRKMRRK